MYFSVDRGTGLIWYYYNVFCGYEALAWFGIVTMFFCGLEALAYIGIITMFLWRRLPFCHVQAEVFLKHVTVFAVIFSVISFVFSLQMFGSDRGWRRLPVSVKPDLGELISILLKSKADSTTKRYKKEILKFIEYCNFSGLRPVPPFPVAFIVAYLFKVYKSSSSYASLVMTHAALKWFHWFGLSNGANPLDTSICHNLLEAAKRDKPVSVKKAPISAEIIKSIIDKFAGLSANLKDIRVACICSLSFAGFFRYNELSNIAPVHLEFFPDCLRVFVPRAKNDIYREGNYVYIKRLNSQYCLVALLERYIFMCNIDLSSSVAFFRPVRFFKSTNSYKLYGVKLSYTRCREIFKECLKEVGVDYKLYGLHSLRSGGATK